MEFSENIKELLGENFKDDMTAEDVLKFLNDKKIADLGTGKYVSAAKHQAEIDEEKKKKKAIEDKLKEKLTEDEKKELEAKQERERLIAKEKMLNEEIANNAFEKAGLTKDEYSVISGDLDPELAKKIAEVMSKKAKEYEDKIKELELKKIPDPKGGEGIHTDKKFSELSLDERMVLKEKDPKEYERLKNAK